MTNFEELNKLDTLLGLPAGTSRSVIANCDQTHLRQVNDRLVEYNIVLDDDTSVPAQHKAAWRTLMQKAGIGNVWWLDDSLAGTVENLKAI